jgi:8-oxo-dGTP diphosphatase
MQVFVCIDMQSRISCNMQITVEENRHYCTIFMKGVVNPMDVQNLRTMEPHKLDGDWAWITWEELVKGNDQIRPLFTPLQNLLTTRPSFAI